MTATRSPHSSHAHDDLPSAREMHADCAATTRTLGSHLERAAQRVSRPTPSILFEDYPREVRKRDIEVSEAAQRLANALHLHLD